MDPVIWVWLALALIFIILEVFAPGFIFACFVVGAIGGGVTSVFTDSYVIQGVVFAVISLALIPLTRRFATRITKPSPAQSNMDRFIDQNGVVKNEVSEVNGQITVDGQVWQARATETIPVGAKVKIIAVDGAKLKVEKLA